MTPTMQANDFAHAFNSTTERQHWRAYVGGTRNMPTVVFKNRGAMIELVYYQNSNSFAVTFSKTLCSFGDFTSSIHKALTNVLTALKAAGFPVSAPLDNSDGEVRMQYDPKTKVTYVSLADTGDDWQKHNPGPAQQNT